MSETSHDGLRRLDSAQGQEALSLGDALRAMRETRGLSLSEVSARIKYSAVQLGHLEACDWSRLPEGVPLRGLVRNYARFLETDVDAALKLLDDAVGPTRPRPAVTALGALAHHGLYDAGLRRPSVSGDGQGTVDLGG